MSDFLKLNFAEQQRPCMGVIGDACGCSA